MPPSPSHLVSGLHSRGHLPHLKRENAAYFVTLRLADSLPREAILKFKHEREAIVQNALIGNRPLTWREQQQLFVWYSERVELLLDSGAGECWLAKPRIAKLVADAFRYFAGKRYDLRSWVIMPNHAHVIVWPHAGHNLSGILHSWKSFTGTMANRLLDRAGRHFWQKESYNHWIRDDEEAVRLGAYIINNPVKARLCKAPEDWRWSSAYRGSSQ